MDRATNAMETLEVFLSAVEDKGVWYMETKIKGQSWREKVENANTPNTEEAALDLIQKTNQYIRHVILSNSGWEASS